MTISGPFSADLMVPLPVIEKENLTDFPSLITTLLKVFF